MKRTNYTEFTRMCGDCLRLPSREVYTFTQVHYAIHHGAIHDYEGGFIHINADEIIPALVGME